MDYTKLKGRPPYPFETIAVAIAFSPRLEAILTEAKWIADLFGSNLLFIHIGEKNPDKESQLDKLVSKLGFNEHKLRVIWMEGEPVETILHLCKLNIVDLLILGALERESFFRFYIGSIARTISRKAKCSVLLLCKVSSEQKKLRKIIVNGTDNPKTIHTINTALYIACHYRIKEITVVKEVHVPALSMTIGDDTAPEAQRLKKDLNEEEEDKLHDVLEKCNVNEVIIKEKMIQGKPGYAIAKYARDKKAHLLVVNSPDTELGILDRIFTHDIEYILAHLPCNVLIVHSRIPKL